ncbi:Protein shisa-9 [Orchesella cincta]|uniref:Protein shisa-9 n=1 Tax=Orchesella cincta TaxID=48709 RepID=A0A1D2NDW4_ORCCI|nr:Protein shisa-9 [Orchesella cincta]
MSQQVFFTTKLGLLYFTDLGKDYCTGYTDIDGKWNTGFYCPQYGSKTAVFCCGNDAFKYCCTDQKPVDESSSDSAVLLDGDDPNFGDDGVSSAVFVRDPIVFGVVCGIAAVLILSVVAACYFCSCCFAYKKRRDDPSHLPVGLYRTSNSTTSNLLNLYSPAGTNTLTANSLVTTPRDLDWTLQHHNNLASGPSSISSTYRSQHQYPSLQFPVPGNGTLAPALAAVLSQRGSQSSTPSSLIYSSCGGAGNSTPSAINNAAAQNRLQSTTNATLSAAAYHNLLNSSTSTLSSTRQIPPAQLPQQISNAASIVSSYLASIQQQGYISPDTPMTPLQPPPPYERARHPSPPPTYFQTISAYQNGNNTRNSSSNRSYSSNNNTNNRTRMASIQSVLGGNTNSSPGCCNNDDDLTDFILRHENTLRRTLSMGVDNNRSTTGNNNRNSRGNAMLTHRELMELLLRLTHNPPPPSSSSGSSTVSRSESRAGSDSTTRSTASSTKLGVTHHSTHHLGAGTNMTTSFGNKNTSVSNCTLTINELDEDMTQNRGSDAISKTSKAELTLTSASRIADNDSGVPSSTCSTAGSEASAVIGSIKAISRDFSEEAVKLKKQHALDDDDENHHHHAFTPSRSVDVDLVRNRKLHQQQLAASIHPEANCVAEEIPTTDSGVSVIKACDGGSDVEIIMESTPNTVHNGEGAIINKSPPTVPNTTVPCENVISSSTQIMQ